MDELKETFKYPRYSIDKSECYERFLSLLKKTTIELLSDVKNYTSSLECKICHKKIQDHRNIDHFHLYTEDREHYMTFHFKCALKPKTGEKFDEIAGNLDYIFYIDNEKKENINT